MRHNLVGEKFMPFNSQLKVNKIISANKSIHKGQSTESLAMYYFWEEFGLYNPQNFKNHFHSYRETDWFNISYGIQS